MENERYATGYDRDYSRDSLNRVKFISVLCNSVGIIIDPFDNSNRQFYVTIID